MPETSADRALVDSLPPVSRLAIAYAPTAARAPWLGLLALDARLAKVVREAREPVLGQIRLAWWRERLGEPTALWPRGEPLLARLRVWNGRHEGLAALVDGWEALLGEAPLGRSSLQDMAEGRARAIAELAALLGLSDHAQAAERLGRNWAMADLADRLSHPEERAAAAELAGAQDWRPIGLPRQLRPLIVLHGLAARSLRRKRSGVGTLLAAMRLGIFGR